MVTVVIRDLYSIFISCTGFLLPVVVTAGVLGFPLVSRPVSFRLLFMDFLIRSNFTPIVSSFLFLLGEQNFLLRRLRRPSLCLYITPYFQHTWGIYVG